ncbi:MAG: hypothetical protein AB2598_14670 [Candidatus Thiodiazotropha sp.]
MEASTVAVNALLMFKLLYLFDARYITVSVLNWEGSVGKRYML